MGSTRRTYGHEYQSSGIPFVRIENLRGGRIDAESIIVFIDAAGDEKLKRSRLAANDVLFSLAGTIGRTAIVTDNDVPANTNQALGIVRGYEAVYEPRFLSHILSSPEVQSLATSAMRGGAMNNISLGDLKSLDLPIPPMREQGRIVEEIDKQLTRLDAGVAALKRVEANLKRYKAAVLKAAIEGRLTEKWRAEHADVEPASELLKRILTERRRRWEQSELAKMRIKGKLPTDDRWKKQYPEPETPEVPDSAGNPGTWCWATLSQLGLLDRGKSRHRPRDAEHLYGGRYPFIQTGEIGGSDGMIRSWKRTYSEAGLAQSRLWPAGTLCITIAANIAETAILGFDGCFPDSVVGFRGEEDEIDVRYVEFYMRTAQSELERLAPATAQKNINLATLRRLAVPLPPLPEQLEIVAEVERRLSVASAIISANARTIRRASRLRQSIFKRAFEGKLVPQDPTDEPASVLLDRIRAARAAPGASRTAFDKQRRRKQASTA